MNNYPIKKNFRRLYNKIFLLNTAFMTYPFFVIAFFSYFFSSGDKSLLFLLFKSSVFNVGISYCIVLFGSAINNIVMRRYFFKITYLLQFIGIWLFLYYFLLHNQLIGLPTVYTLLDTNFHELTEFVNVNFNLDKFSIATLFSLPILLFTAWAFDLPIVYKKPSESWSFILLPLLLSSLILYFTNMKPGREYWIEYNPLLIMPSYISIANHEKDKITSLYAQIVSINSIKLTKSPPQTTHILVLSESINRNHMSLYGYNRDTTPQLNSLADKLFILQNTCSSRTTTIPALKEMLTFASREDASNLFKAPNILQIMHAAGFETYWLSNQQAVGMYDSFISLFAKSADHQLFVDHRGWAKGSSFDEKLFQPLKEIVNTKKPKKFIVIHLIGAHQNYVSRYPQHYAKFDNLITPNPINQVRFSPDAMKLFNEYDNAILYSDYIAAQLIALQNPNDLTTFFYISDHSESLGNKDEFFGHVENMHYRSVYEIPAFFWFSDPAKSFFAPEITHLKNNLTQPFQADQMIHTLLDLYGPQYPLINPEHSLFNPAFKSKNRYCDHLTS